MHSIYSVKGVRILITLFHEDIYQSYCKTFESPCNRCMLLRMRIKQNPKIEQIKTTIEMALAVKKKTCKILHNTFLGELGAFKPSELPFCLSFTSFTLCVCLFECLIWDLAKPLRFLGVKFQSHLYAVWFMTDTGFALTVLTVDIPECFQGHCWIWHGYTGLQLIWQRVTVIIIRFPQIFTKACHLLLYQLVTFTTQWCSGLNLLLWGKPWLGAHLHEFYCLGVC